MTETPFIPQFTRYPPAISTHLVRIAKAQTRVDSARVLPPQEEILRVSALAETIHFSTLLEGNHLTQIEAERALRHELDAHERAEIELVNYVAALEMIELAGADGITYDEAFLLRLHELITRGLGRLDTSFEPRHEGTWRDGVAIIPGALGEIEHVGAPPAEVEMRTRGVLSYLERNHASDEYPGAVLAAVAHHAITDIHPFADGNGRTARAFAFAVLMRERIMNQRRFSPDRHYALDKPAYLTALRSANRLGQRTDIWSPPGNLEKWLLYYTAGLASEYERMAERVQELDRVASQVTATRLQLTDTQEHVVAVLAADQRPSISRQEYQTLEHVSQERASREISALVAVKLLVASGRGRGTRYQLPGRRPAATRWTDQTIEAALREFLKGRDAWPARQEFVDAGQGGLYIAMSRHGGVPSWSRRVGL